VEEDIAPPEPPQGPFLRVGGGSRTGGGWIHMICIQGIWIQRRM
jgi:hypothetical protein